MKFKQKTNYQNISGIGRDCEERWNIINNFVTEDLTSLSIDIGSAEGYFSKKLCEKTKGKVISVEGSKYVNLMQKSYCKEEISNGLIDLHSSPLTLNTIDNFTNNCYDYCLMLSVLHWFDEPDRMLQEFSKISKIMFIELPELDDKNSWNQEYLHSIKVKYKSISNYITQVTNRSIHKEFKVSSHTLPYRKLLVIT